MTGRKRLADPRTEEEVERLAGAGLDTQSGMGTRGIGYGRPPVSGQFAKGRSGNPKGRPRGTGKARASMARPKSLDEIVLAAASQEVAVTGRDGKVVTVSMAEAIVKI